MIRTEEERRTTENTELRMLPAQSLIGRALPWLESEVLRSDFGGLAA